MTRDRIRGTTRVFALIGHPVAHSQSPDLYNPQFAADDLDAVYVALDVKPDQAHRVGSLLRHMGLAGANLTVPFKSSVLDDLDRVGPVARRLGAVNTVVWEGDQLVGYNTDAPGFVNGLALDLGFDPLGRKTVVLGAGGAGRAVGFGLAAAGASRVTWLNRTPSRAVEAADACRQAFPECRTQGRPLDEVAWEEVAGDADLVVQCTSGPGAAAVAELPIRRLSKRAIWADINYWMDEPPHLEALAARGHRIHRGHWMLACQATGAYRHFTGRSISAEAFLARLG